MEEKLNLVERALMSEEEFKKYLGNKADIVEDSLTVENPLTETLNLRDYRAVGKFKSIRRAIRKGHHSRVMNEVKKSIYGQLKHRRAEYL